MMPMTKLRSLFAIAAFLPLTDFASSEVHEVFANPPPEARLQMWYHWIGDCITEEGIVADLKAMGELGVSTAHIFAPSMADLPVKAKPMDPEWMRLFGVAIREAKRNGLTLGFHNCPGWSSSGGPWITPELSMKKLVWSETDIAAGAVGKITLPQPRSKLGFYRDVAVFAIPLASPPKQVVNPVPKSLGTEKPGTKATLDFRYSSAFVPQYFVFRTARERACGQLEVLAEIDKNWVKVGDMRLSEWCATDDDRVMRLKVPSPASDYRVVFTSRAFPDWMGQHDTRIESASFSLMPHVENVADKNSATSVYGLNYTDRPDETGLREADVRELTACMDFDGVLDLSKASLPATPFRVLRIGCTSTAAGPAPSTIPGLECDKLDPRGIEAHWAAMPAKILALPDAKGVIEYCIIDSFEVGGQNWTGILPQEFAKRRGYPLGKHLVSVCGYSLGTAGDTLKFLWDWQKTIGELIAENYYGRFTELCHENGIKSILEPYGGPFDTHQCAGYADVPTGEFWLGASSHSSPRIAASAAHVHGKVRAAAESFTTEAEEGRWKGTPHEYRVCGDERGWLNGINQIVFHSYVHQPFTGAKPGLSLGRHGSQFNRNTTWWKEGRYWTDYVRRGQSLLQFGKPKAEFLVIGGDRADELMRLGYNFDFAGETDIDLLEVRDGKLAIRGAGVYEGLIIRRDVRHFSAERNACLDELEKAGVRIYRGLSITDAVKRFDVKAPFDGCGQLQALRRQGEDGSTVWFVVNVSDKDFAASARFAYEVGTVPERFDAKDGCVEKIEFKADNGFASVELKLAPHESAFVVFSRKPAAKAAEKGEVGGNIVELDSGWKIVSFDGPNAPSVPLALDRLSSWSESSDPKLRYFSGRAVYEREVVLPDGAVNPVLDLGKVKELVNVYVDDAFVGCLWEAPFRIPLSVRGKFRLRLEVVNCWPNRMIGDAMARANGAAEPKVDGRWPKWVLDGRSDSGTGIFTWTCWGEAFTPDYPLRESGLLGPVRLFVDLTQVSGYHRESGSM